MKILTVHQNTQPKYTSFTYCLRQFHKNEKSTDQQHVMYTERYTCEAPSHSVHVNQN